MSVGAIAHEFGKGFTIWLQDEREEIGYSLQQTFDSEPPNADVIQIVRVSSSHVTNIADDVILFRVGGGGEEDEERRKRLSSSDAGTGRLPATSEETVDDDVIDTDSDVISLEL